MNAFRLISGSKVPLARSLKLWNLASALVLDSAQDISPHRWKTLRCRKDDEKWNASKNKIFCQVWLVLIGRCTRFVAPGFGKYLNRNSSPPWDFLGFSSNDWIALPDRLVHPSQICISGASISWYSSYAPEKMDRQALSAHGDPVEFVSVTLTEDWYVPRRIHGSPPICLHMITVWFMLAMRRMTLSTTLGGVRTAVSHLKTWSTFSWCAPTLARLVFTLCQWRPGETGLASTSLKNTWLLLSRAWPGYTLMMINQAGGRPFEGVVATIIQHLPLIETFVC